MSKKINIVYSSFILGMSGFATISRDTILEFYKRGARIKIKPFDKDEVGLKELEEGKILSKLKKTVITERPIWFTQTGPMQIYPNAGYSVGFVVWESPDWHKKFFEQLKKQDEIWTASNFNKKGLEEGGIKNVYLMPHAVNIYRFSPEVEPLPRDKILENKFVFLSIMGWSERKGVDILLRAYYEEFNRDDDVCLYIKFAYYDFNRALKEVEKIKKKVGKGKKSPMIVLDTKIYTFYEMPRLYKMCDVFVLPSRGEGFGLNYIEAMAMEMPVIGTFATAMTDFLDEEYSYPVKNNGFEINKNCDWISPHYPGVRFAVPDLEHLKQRMREVYENRKEAKEKGKRARKYIIENYSWEVIGDKMWKRVLEIDKSMVKFKIPKGFV